MKKQSIVIFDLDGTVIDSSHRHLSKPDGSVDLDHWRENCTAEKIAADTLLPLARSMRGIYASGAHVIVCTARVMSEHDLAFLDRHGLKYHGMLSRGEGDCRGDADMKVDKLWHYLCDMGYSSIKEAGCIMFDDNVKVLVEMSLQGVIAINATKENARQAA